MINSDEAAAIARYKECQEALPNGTHVIHLMLHDFDEGDLHQYVLDAQVYTKALKKAAEARQEHYERFIEGRREEDEGHRYYREALNKAAAQAEETLRYWEARMWDQCVERVPQVIIREAYVENPEYNPRRPTAYPKTLVSKRVKRRIKQKLRREKARVERELLAKLAQKPHVYSFGEGRISGSQWLQEVTQYRHMEAMLPALQGNTVYHSDEHQDTIVGHYLDIAAECRDIQVLGRELQPWQHYRFRELELVITLNVEIRRAVYTQMLQRLDLVEGRIFTMASWWWVTALYGQAREVIKQTTRSHFVRAAWNASGYLWRAQYVTLMQGNQLEEGRQLQQYSMLLQTPFFQAEDDRKLLPHRYPRDLTAAAKKVWQLTRQSHMQQQNALGLREKKRQCELIYSVNKTAKKS